MPGSRLKIKLFEDCAELKEMVAAHAGGLVSGFTTNPSLMKKAGVTDYEAFARSVLKAIPDMPISFEVFSDDFAGMEREARKIAGWGENVYVKIPVTNTRGESSAGLVRRLASDGLKLNVTAILTTEQVREVAGALSDGVPSIVSVFAGRIADTGRDPVPYMKKAASILRPISGAQLLWAAQRELLNIPQAEACGCHIITVKPEALRNMALLGRELHDVSMDTVRTFHSDAKAAGFKI